MASTISQAVIQYQTSRETIRETLAEIAADWEAQGIETPVITEDGEIDPDADLELSARL